MTLYHQAAFTLDPYSPIPDDAAPAAIEETGQAEELAAFSQEYAAETAVALTSELSGLYVTCTLTVGEGIDLPGNADLDVHWNWGDGTDETGHDLLQGHAYSLTGSRTITARIERPGRPSIEVSTTIEI